MYEESINILKQQGVQFEKGLTFDEIAKIEEIYEIQFPKSLKDFFMVVLPISKGFYNWRNITQDNINYIKQMIKRPMQDIEEFAEEINWCDDWGKEPTNEIELRKSIQERLRKAPKLLPIYSHRYMPMFFDDNPPIVSVHEIDIIYYGEDLEDYFEIEFGRKRQDEIEFHNIKAIPFWSDIM